MVLSIHIHTAYRVSINFIAFLNHLKHCKITISINVIVGWLVVKNFLVDIPKNTFQEKVIHSLNCPKTVNIKLSSHRKALTVWLYLHHYGLRFWKIHVHNLCTKCWVNWSHLILSILCFRRRRHRISFLRENQIKWSINYTDCLYGVVIEIH